MNAAINLVIGESECNGGSPPAVEGKTSREGAYRQHLKKKELPQKGRHRDEFKRQKTAMGIGTSIRRGCRFRSAQGHDRAL